MGLCAFLVIGCPAEIRIPPGPPSLSTITVSSPRMIAIRTNHAFP